jgi:L,D-transpeptidase YbiS
MIPGENEPIPAAPAPAGAVPPPVAAPAVPAAPRRRGRRVLAAIATVAGLSALTTGALATLDGAGERPLAAVPPPALVGEAPPAKELARLDKRLAAERPRGVYIVIDAVDNRLRLKKGEEVVLDALCSTGTGAVLKDPGSDRRWVFDSPRGAHRVQVKLVEPVWKKPDWAFIEEGEPVPSDPRERFDHEALGDYGLYFGDGFLIHGTLYQRLLGRSVTHGCVRLGDKDLEAVYRGTPLGTPIFIF